VEKRDVQVRDLEGMSVYIYIYIYIYMFFFIPRLSATFRGVAYTISGLCSKGLHTHTHGLEQSGTRPVGGLLKELVRR